MAWLAWFYVWKLPVVSNFLWADSGIKKEIWSQKEEALSTVLVLQFWWTQFNSIIYVWSKLTLDKLNLVAQLSRCDAAEGWLLIHAIHLGKFGSKWIMTRTREKWVSRLSKREKDRRFSFPDLGVDFTRQEARSFLPQCKWRGGEGYWWNVLPKRKVLPICTKGKSRDIERPGFQVSAHVDEPQPTKLAHHVDKALHDAT